MKNLFSIPNRLLYAGLVCLLGIGNILPVAAQRTMPSSFEDDYIFWGYPNAYLNYQSKTGFPLINRMLQANPPAVEMNQHRKFALITLDQFLHDADCQRRDAFYPFINSRMEEMLEGIDQPVLSGVRIYKLYNSGFILQTLKTTIAVDVVPGGTTNNKPFLTDSVIFEVAARCDALLITNADGKHANRNVANAFVDMGKKVILPEGMWTDMEEFLTPVGADTTEIVQLGAMTLYVLPGHKNNAKNNIYVMNFHGRGVVAHTGAQDNDADWEWIDNVHSRYNIDILLTKSQNINMESMLAGFRPRMVITGHENDIESAVDRRESYWTTQKRMKSLSSLGISNVILTWGESYEYADTSSPNISSSATKVMMKGALYIERKGSIYSPTGRKLK
ncbi:MAG: MBL fold metallo-hydrolase [Paludibacteraceae bacterium]|nr:MBL fold metallo-hydrolase [Paludibacteraceae bacterium]